MTAARTIGGEPMSERRTMIASVAYAVPMAAIFVLTGYAIRGGLQLGSTKGNIPEHWGMREFLSRGRSS